MKRRIDTDGWFTVLDAWYGSKDLLDAVAIGLGFTMIVEGKANYVFRIHGKDLFELKEVRWHNSTQMPLLRYARVRAIVLVHSYWFCGRKEKRGAI